MADTRILDTVSFEHATRHGCTVEEIESVLRNAGHPAAPTPAVTTSSPADGWSRNAGSWPY